MLERSEWRAGRMVRSTYLCSSPVQFLRDSLVESDSVDKQMTQRNGGRLERKAERIIIKS